MDWNNLDRYITVQGVRLRYWEIGPTDTNSSVILLHGLNGLIEHWIMNILSLAKSHRVYALDLPGAGYSDSPKTSYSLSTIANLVNGFLLQMGVSKGSFIGHSLGGAVALQLRLLFPERINKLILVDSLGFGREIIFTARLASIPILGEFLTLRVFKRVKRRLNQYAYDPSSIDAEFLSVLKQKTAKITTRANHLKMLREICNINGVRSHVLDLVQQNSMLTRVPVLIIWGKQDPILPSSHASIAKKVFPHSQLCIFHNCGHVPQIEAADRFNDCILKYLAN